jgi:hypothetical protein
VVCEGEPVKFAFIAEMDEENKRKPRGERFPVTFMCEILEVSRQGYYAWKNLAHVTQAAFEFTEVYCNRKRIQKGLGYLLPSEYELGVDIGMALVA